MNNIKAKAKIKPRAKPIKNAIKEYQPSKDRNTHIPNYREFESSF